VDHSGSIETAHYRIDWNSSGQLTHIYDKDSQRKVIPSGKCANVLQIFEDKPRCFDAWELESTFELKEEDVTSLRSVKVEKDAIGTEVSFEWAYHKSMITQTMCVYEDSRRIDFKTTVDWKERQKMLKASFPVDVRAVDARFDIQNGNIRRPITRNTTWEMAKFEVVAHKWVDLWETGYGMAVLNDCKYGHDVKEDTIRLTLLKSAIYPDYTADQGTHCFTYAILPHKEEWYQAEIEQQAFFLNNLLTAKPGRTTLGEESWFTFSSDRIVVDAVKRAENSDDVVIRFHEYTGARERIQIDTLLPVEGWCECNLMEEAMEEYRDDNIELLIKPYEIKTILLKLKKDVI
jgi:alpha-mannosidase